MNERIWEEREVEGKEREGRNGNRGEVKVYRWKRMEDGEGGRM